MYENADFSPGTIKNSIKEGEMKTIQALKKYHVNNQKEQIWTVSKTVRLL
jgi:hypothetical protein